MKMELLVLTILTALTFTCSSVVDLEPSKMVDIVDDLSGDALKFGAFHVGWGGSPPSSGWSSHSRGWSPPFCSRRTMTHTQYLRSTSTVTKKSVSTITSTLVIEGAPTSTVSTICAPSSVCTHPATTIVVDLNVLHMVTAMYYTLKDYIEVNQN